MSMADLAEKEGLKPKPFKAAQWLDAHKELFGEIQECRRRGYSWKGIADLLRKHHGYTGSQDALMRAANAEQ